MWSCAIVTFLVAYAGAITRDQFYPHGPGLDQRLPRGAEVASPEIHLSVPILFYGETYESIFVNNYGVLSFRADYPSFLNAEFPLPYPSIAAFYTNVDTTDGGSVFYRETNEPHVLSKAEESVQNNFHEFYDFKPTSVFIATWIDVTYHERPDRKNSFQIAVISNGNETFAELLYPEREIQWIQREALPPSLPDAKAQAGFVAEDGRMYTMRGSGSHQIRNIVSWSNTHEPGKYVFRIGNIPPDGNVGLPDQYNENEVEVEEESKTCAQSGPSVCHMQARCVDYQAGICCQCNDGFYGNGKSCIKNDVPLRVHGKLNGVINDSPLEDVDIQAYVVVADGRSYTALSQSPPALGNSLQLLNVLGGVVGWLFAIPSGTAKNGYQLTGALFNHSADVFFPATGDRVTIRQEFLGHDVFDQIAVDSDIRGSIPVLVSGTKLEISEYEEQYSVVESGFIRSESSRTFINKATGEKYELRLSQTFSFNPCKFAPPSDEDSIPSTLKVAKNYLGYETNQNIVRYGMSNKIIPLGQEYPCVKGRNTCGPHSSCVVQGETFACVCDNGYTEIYLDNSVSCIDVDECAAGTHNCDVNAECYKHDGGFRCRCKAGYEGNGVTCNSVSQCRDKTCGQNAQCVENTGEGPTCVCNSGYTGDGQTCWPHTEPRDNPCDNCSPYAYCTFDANVNNNVCVCGVGYRGDGHYCSENAPALTTTPYPSYSPYSPQSPSHSSWSPQPSSTQPQYQYPPSPSPTPNPLTIIEAEYNETFVLPSCNALGCTCPPGYSFYRDDRNNELCRIDSYRLPDPTDNYNQPPTDNSTENNDTSIKCDTDSDCPPNAVCYYSPIDPFGSGHCTCPEGYEGDAYECIERTGSCSCGAYAHCIDNAAGEAMCVCDTGYHGDGYLCRPNFICTNNTDCEYHAECRPDERSGEYVCQCIEGYIKDQNDACIPDEQLCNGAVCAEHASCLYDEAIGVSYCHCDQGYEGEGIAQCVPQGNTCEVSNDCHPNAQCTPYDNTYQCVCNDGYTGDGYHCVLEATCRNNPYLCDIHASCLKRNDGYVCECNTGYNGNGSYCILNPRQAGNFLIASDGATVYKVPFRASPRDYATPINSAIFQIAVGIDVDCDTGRIYWGDVVGNAIKRTAYDGSGFEPFLSVDVKSPEGVSIDWSARNIFWTDSKKLTIEVANLDTKIRKVLFSKEGILNPRGIVVHPQRGKIFWSDWNRKGPKVEWSNMDGSQRGIFLDQSDVRLPNSLAIDWIRDRLCYADAGLFSIRCIGIDTLERETIADDCSYPFGLSINKNTFYWTDWKTFVAAGKKFALALYYSNCECETLDEMRPNKYLHKIATQSVNACFQLASLPPTSDTCPQHSLRLYLQNLQKAMLTHHFHCCAFAFPEIHDPERHASYQARAASMQKQCEAEKKKLADELSLRQQRSLEPIRAIRIGSRNYHDEYRDDDDLNTASTVDDSSESEEYADLDMAQEDGGMWNPNGPVSDTINGLTLPENCSTFSIRNKVECTPVPNALNPCEDVMGWSWLRASVWIVISAAVVGNVAVLMVLLTNHSELTVPRFLMCHLAFSDLCTGVYLFMLAVVDLRSFGEFFNHAYDWQYGVGCKIAGFLSVFSGQLSVFTLTIVTLERWFAITYAIYLERRITLRSAAKIMLGGWLFAILLAGLPLLGVSDYSSTSICLPVESENVGDAVYQGSLFLTNAVAWVTIVICYVQIYRSLGGGGEKYGGRGAAAAAERRIANKMALLIGTDLLCWAPVAFFGVTALAGAPLVDVSHGKVLLVFFYPLNACANPFLYAILTKQYRRDFIMLIARTGMCNWLVEKYKLAATPPPTGHTNPSAPILPLVDRQKSQISDSKENGEAML